MDLSVALAVPNGGSDIAGGDHPQCSWPQHDVAGLFRDPAHQAVASSSPKVQTLALTNPLCQVAAPQLGSPSTRPANGVPPSPGAATTPASNSATAAAADEDGGAPCVTSPVASGTVGQSPVVACCDLAASLSGKIDGPADTQVAQRHHDPSTGMPQLPPPELCAAPLLGCAAGLVGAHHSDATATHGDPVAQVTAAHHGNAAITAELPLNVLAPCSVDEADDELAGGIPVPSVVDIAITAAAAKAERRPAISVMPAPMARLAGSPTCQAAPNCSAALETNGVDPSVADDATAAVAAETFGRLVVSTMPADVAAGPASQTVPSLPVSASSGAGGIVPPVAAAAVKAQGGAVDSTLQAVACSLSPPAAPSRAAAASEADNIHPLAAAVQAQGRRTDSAVPLPAAPTARSPAPSDSATGARRRSAIDAEGVRRAPAAAPASKVDDDAVAQPMTSGGPPASSNTEVAAVSTGDAATADPVAPADADTASAAALRPAHKTIEVPAAEAAISGPDVTMGTATAMDEAAPAGTQAAGDPAASADATVDVATLATAVGANPAGVEAADGPATAGSVEKACTSEEGQLQPPGQAPQLALLDGVLHLDRNPVFVKKPFIQHLFPEGVAAVLRPPHRTMAVRLHATLDGALVTDWCEGDLYAYHKRGVYLRGATHLAAVKGKWCTSLQWWDGGRDGERHDRRNMKREDDLQDSGRDDEQDETRGGLGRDGGQASGGVRQLLLVTQTAEPTASQAAQGLGAAQHCEQQRQQKQRRQQSERRRSEPSHAPVMALGNRLQPARRRSEGAQPITKALPPLRRSAQTQQPLLHAAPPKKLQRTSGVVGAKRPRGSSPSPRPQQPAATAEPPVAKKRLGRPPKARPAAQDLKADTTTTAVPANTDSAQEGRAAGLRAACRVADGRNAAAYEYPRDVNDESSSHDVQDELPHSAGAAPDAAHEGDGRARLAVEAVGEAALLPPTGKDTRGGTSARGQWASARPGRPCAKMPALLASRKELPNRQLHKVGVGANGKILDGRVTKGAGRTRSTGGTSNAAGGTGVAGRATRRLANPGNSDKAVGAGVPRSNVCCVKEEKAAAGDVEQRGQPFLWQDLYYEDAQAGKWTKIPKACRMVSAPCGPGGQMKQEPEKVLYGQRTIRPEHEPMSAEGTRVSSFKWYRLADGATAVPRSCKGGGDDPSMLQVSIACHQCMYQHIPVRCRNVVEATDRRPERRCTWSYCGRCVASHYTELTYDQLAASCPFCRGLCRCRRCLRKDDAERTVTRYSDEQEQVFARYVLSRVGRHIMEHLRLEDVEAGPGGVESAVYTNMELDRAVCDCCATSLANVYRHCPTCSWDICVRCASSARVPGSDAPASCINPQCVRKAVAAGTARPALELMRFQDDQRVAILRKIAQAHQARAEAGGTSTSGDAQGWRWLDCDPPPPPEDVKDHFVRPVGADKVSIWGYTLPKEDVRRAANRTAGGTNNRGSTAAGSTADGTANHGTTGSTAGETAGEGTAGRTGDAAGDAAGGETYGVWSDYLFSPHFNSFKAGAPQRALYTSLFLDRWSAREPVMMRGVKGKMPWDPETMLRACQEKCLTAREDGTNYLNQVTTVDLDAIDCNDWSTFSMRQYQFFKHYRRHPEDAQTAGATERDTKREKFNMLKVKDWPPNVHFREKLGRHHQDFLEMLPLPEFTHPHAAPLNLATHTPAFANATDLGPKTYIAFGQLQEHEGEGDSVTKLHQDMSDAINVLTHSQLAPQDVVIPRCGVEPCPTSGSFGCAGAMWDIWRAEDAEKLCDWLVADVRKNPGRHIHHGKPVNADLVQHAVFDQVFMVTAAVRNEMRRDLQIEPWHFEQYADESIFIPGGTPHQVRNLRSCIKVAVDFVSPEALDCTQQMCDALRQCALRVRPLPTAQGAATTARQCSDGEAAAAVAASEPPAAAVNGDAAAAAATTAVAAVANTAVQVSAAAATADAPSRSPPAATAVGAAAAAAGATIAVAAAANSAVQAGDAAAAADAASKPTAIAVDADVADATATTVVEAAANGVAAVAADTAAKAVVAVDAVAATAVGAADSNTTAVETAADADAPTAAARASEPAATADADAPTIADAASKPTAAAVDADVADATATTVVEPAANGVAAVAADTSAKAVVAVDAVAAAAVTPAEAAADVAKGAAPATSVVGAVPQPAHHHHPRRIVPQAIVGSSQGTGAAAAGAAKLARGNGASRLRRVRLAQQDPTPGDGEGRQRAGNQTAAASVGATDADVGALEPAHDCAYSDKLQCPLIFLGGAVDAWLKLHPVDGEGLTERVRPPVAAQPCRFVRKRTDPADGKMAAAVGRQHSGAVKEASAKGRGRGGGRGRGAMRKREVSSLEEASSSEEEEKQEAEYEAGGGGGIKRKRDASADRGNSGRGAKHQRGARGGGTGGRTGGRIDGTGGRTGGRNGGMGGRTGGQNDGMGGRTGGQNDGIGGRTGGRNGGRGGKRGGRGAAGHIRIDVRLAAPSTKQGSHRHNQKK